MRRTRAADSLRRRLWQPGIDDQAWRLGGNTFTTACGDVDSDGDMDLCNAEIRHWWAGESSDPSQLLVSAGDRFERPGNDATGLGHRPGGVDWNEGDLHAAFFDADGDGRLDILLGASDYPDQTAHLFRQLADTGFEDVAEAAGIAHPRTSGLAVADVDRDGNLDVVVGSGTARCAGDPTCPWTRNEVHLYRNDAASPSGANVLEVRLAGGEGTNRAALGARVRCDDGDRHADPSSTAATATSASSTTSCCTSAWALPAAPISKSAGARRGATTETFSTFRRTRSSRSRRAGGPSCTRFRSSLPS